MSQQRAKFLSNIRNSLRQTLLPAASPEHPGSFQGYSFQPDASLEKLMDMFTQELQALSGHVHRLTNTAGVVPTILGILESHHTRQILAWRDDDLGIPWLSEALTQAGVVVEDGRLGATAMARKSRLAELDGVLVGLSGAQGGLADTGAIALSSGPGRGRLASLLPLVHIALLSAQKLYPSLPAFLAANPEAITRGSNFVLIAGPSRTGDIEMTLSMGVHGPREVHVIIP